MVFNTYFYIQKNDTIDYFSEISLSDSDTFQSILDTYLSEYSDLFIRVYSRNTNTVFNLTDTIINSIEQGDNIVYVLKSNE
jgi:hypothetical protein